MPTISKTTIHRLAKDIKELKQTPLHDHGIYYAHGQEDILYGQALIIGREDTPYAYGNYLFEFRFPPEYPFKPPILKYKTNDGTTRFNPNLYRNEKVCLSILNTWRGDSWTSCQTISTVLLNLCMILNNNPLLNEPGITDKHPDINAYNNIISYKNVEIAIVRMLMSSHIKHEYQELYEAMKSNFLLNKEKIIENLKKLRTLDKTSLSTTIYNQNIYVDIENLLLVLININLQN